MKKAAVPATRMPRIATHRFWEPAAIPATTAKMTNAVSRVSRTTVRKRTMERAPVKLNARATLSPMTRVTMAIKTARRTSVVGKETEWATIASRRRALTRRYRITPWSAAAGSAVKSGILFPPMIGRKSADGHGFDIIVQSVHLEPGLQLLTTAITRSTSSSRSWGWIGRLNSPWAKRWAIGRALRTS